MQALRAYGRACQLCLRNRSSNIGGNQQLRGIFVSVLVKKNEKDIDALKANPYFDKYSEKIYDQLRTSPQDLIERLNAIHKKKVARQDSDATPGQTSLAFTRTKLLDKIVKLDLLKLSTAQEISDIWLQHHAESKDALAGVISREVHHKIVDKGSRHPTFLLPLPRNKGYEYFVSQFNNNEFHFTPLINFQTFKENAPECLVLTHYTELDDEKGIVLIRGEFNSDVVDSTEAVCLINQLQRYYGEDDERRQKLLERFTFSPMDFHHMDLIVELERLAL